MNVDVLKGKTLKNIEQSDDEIVFETTEGDKYKLYHEQDCCEYVYIEDISGDLKDLLGNPLLEAEEVEGYTNGEPASEDYDYNNSYTWTYYKFGTIKGHVSIRWLGTSNGYYSESVDFIKIKT